MADDENKFLERLMQVFKQETRDHLAAMTNLLQVLDKQRNQPAPLKTMEHLRLEVHSLKGAAQSVNRRDIESLCQEAESLLIRLTKNEATASTNFIWVLGQLVDYVDCAVVNPAPGEAAASPVPLQSMLRAL